MLNLLVFLSCITRLGSLAPEEARLFSIYAGGPILVVFLVGSLITGFLIRKSRFMTGALAFLFVGGLVANFRLPSIAYARAMSRIHESQSYLEGIVPQLESFKEKNKRYPLSLSEIKFDPTQQPYFVANHLGFSSCTTPHNAPSNSRWYCPLNDGHGFELSFGYEDELDLRPSYRFTNVDCRWKCSGEGCITDRE